MWKKHSKSQPFLTTSPSPTTDVTQTINNVLLATLTLQLEVQEYHGIRGDHDFMRIQLKLMENLLELNEAEKYCQNSAELQKIKQVELKIKNCLSNLELNAAGGITTTFPLPKRSSSLVTVHSYQANPDEDVVDELGKVGQVMYQIKIEIRELEKKLDNQNIFISSDAINMLEKKIVQLSDELENVEIDQSSDLHKTKTELLKSLVKFSGKLKKIRRRDSMQSSVDSAANKDLNHLQKLRTDLKKLEERAKNASKVGNADQLLKQNIESLIRECAEASLKSNDDEINQEYNKLTNEISTLLADSNDVPQHSDGVELRSKKDSNNSQEVRTSLKVLNNRLSNLREQIALIYNGNNQQDQILEAHHPDMLINNNTIDAKIKLTAFKLAWEELIHTLSQEIEIDVLGEIVLDLSDIESHLATGIKRIKKYIRQRRRSSSEEYNESKVMLRGLLDEMQALRIKINCYSGIYGDQRFKEVKYEIECCLQKVDALDSSDVKVQLAKTKIKSKLLEYLQLLDEKAVKL